MSLLQLRKERHHCSQDRSWHWVHKITFALNCRWRRKILWNLKTLSTDSRSATKILFENGIKWSTKSNNNYQYKLARYKVHPFQSFRDQYVFRSIHTSAWLNPSCLIQFSLCVTSPFLAFIQFLLPLGYLNFMQMFWVCCCFTCKYWQFRGMSFQRRCYTCSTYRSYYGKNIWILFCILLTLTVFRSILDSEILCAFRRLLMYWLNQVIKSRKSCVQDSFGTETHSWSSTMWVKNLHFWKIAKIWSFYPLWKFVIRIYIKD